jgi:hypothetical protein
MYLLSVCIALCISLMCFFCFGKPKRERDFEAAHRLVQRKIAQEPDHCTMHRFVWLSVFGEEEDLLDAHLQRQHRLRELRPKIKRDGNEPGKGQVELWRKIAALQKLYYDHLEHVYMFEHVGHTYAPNAEERVLRRRHWDRHGHSFAWLHDRERCADMGGCCGRSCRCCERPFRTYVRNTGNGERTIQVLGHSTRKCECCIQFKGIYLHHHLLPPTAFDFRVPGVANFKNPKRSPLYFRPTNTLEILQKSPR